MYIVGTFIQIFCMACSNTWKLLVFAACFWSSFFKSHQQFSVILSSGLWADQTMDYGLKLRISAETLHYMSPLHWGIAILEYIVSTREISYNNRPQVVIKDVYSSALIFPSGTQIVPTPWNVMYPHINKVNLRFNGGQILSGRYSSPTFLHILTLVSCPIITLHSSLERTLFQRASTFLWILPLHQATRFFSRILIAYESHLSSQLSFFENLRFLPLLKELVIFYKDSQEHFFAILKRALASRTPPNSFGRQDRS